ncbi:MAG: hypothetical protein GX255_03765 [Erysipelotrichia bacterium]|nr:hypothetical protein [Erysipelotrichia bacterium]
MYTAKKRLTLSEFIMTYKTKKWHRQYNKYKYIDEKEQIKVIAECKIKD